MANDLFQMRMQAGKRYAAAVAELQAAYVELAGIDLAINSGNVPSQPIPTFRGDADRVPWEFRHPDFHPEAGDSLRDGRTARLEELLRQHAR